MGLNDGLLPARCTSKSIRGHGVTDTDTDALMDLIQRESLVERSRLSAEARLEDIGIASIDLISIVFAIEEKYGVDLSTVEIDGTATLGEFTEIVQQKISERDQ